MPDNAVTEAIESLQDALNDGEHTCTVQIEPMGDMTQVVFCLDGDEDDPAGVLNLVNPA